jgi:hypothetical protein
MARYDDLNTSAIAYATFISAVLLVVIILLVQTLTFNWLLGEDERKLAESHYTASDNEIAKQKAKLDVYEKVKVEVIPPAADGAAPTEPAKPVLEERLRVPIKQAKNSILKELKKPADNPAGT